MTDFVFFFLRNRRSVFKITCGLQKYIVSYIHTRNSVKNNFDNLFFTRDFWRSGMRISTKGRYALRLMIDLAMNNSGKPVRIKEIANRQEISDKYLEQIISILNKARFVRSIRGPQGGYLLTKKPEEYTVGMILRLTEGSMAPVECIDDAIGGCSRMESCATSVVWHKLNDAISEVIDNITLADLVDWQVSKNGEYMI